jgi:hypothetical protein
MGNFINDRRDGEYIAYYKSGKIKEKATYKNGKLAGEFLSFDTTDLEDQIDDLEDEPYTLADEEALQDKEKTVDDLLKKMANFEKEQKKP